MNFKQYMETIFDDSGNPEAGVGMAVRRDRIATLKRLVAQIKKNLAGSSGMLGSVSLASIDPGMAKTLADALKEFESALQDAEEQLSNPQNHAIMT